MGTKPNHADWTKLCQMDKLTLRADGSGCLKWHGDAVFALHHDFRSHTGSTFSMGDGAITSLSRKGLSSPEHLILLCH